MGQKEVVGKLRLQGSVQLLNIVSKDIIVFSTIKAVKMVADSLRCCRLHTFHLEVLFTKGISLGADVAINLKHIYI